VLYVELTIQRAEFESRPLGGVEPEDPAVADGMPHGDGPFRQMRDLDERRHKALWVRSGLAPGRGEPAFRRINTHRQRRAMRCDLCQVWGTTVTGRRDDERTLYLLGADTPVSEGETTTAPPVHPLCAIEAINICPPLRRAHTAALVEYSPLWGVVGIVHDPVTLTPLQHVFVGDGRIRWTLAGFTVISLYGVTAVSTDELHAMAAEEQKTATGFCPLA